MDFKIIDETGFFDNYVKTFLKKNVFKHINTKKELIYLPKDTNMEVAKTGLKFLVNQVESIEIGLSKNKSLTYIVKYKD